jgi:hypothetical protein
LAEAAGEGKGEGDNVISNIKLMIRSDDEAMLVRAYIATTDETKKTEIATISYGLVNNMPHIFEQWKELLTLALTDLSKLAGLEPVGWTEIKREPGDCN